MKKIVRKEKLEKWKNKNVGLGQTIKSGYIIKGNVNLLELDGRVLTLKKRFFSCGEKYLIYRNNISGLIWFQSKENTLLKTFSVITVWINSLRLNAKSLSALLKLNFALDTFYKTERKTLK